MPLRYSAHARQRMQQRGITEEDVETALNRQIRTEPGNQLGSVWVYGYAADGTILKVCVPTADRTTVITVVRP